MFTGFACSSDPAVSDVMTSGGSGSVGSGGRGSGGSADNSSGGVLGASGGEAASGGATSSGGETAGSGGESGEFVGCRSFENGSGAANPCYVGVDGKAHCIQNDGTTVTLSEVLGTAVSASGWDYTTRACVVSDTGTVSCGDYGALQEWLSSDVTQVSGMADGYCALAGGEVFCQKKDGDLETVDLGSLKANMVGCFSFGCCAATLTKELFCWGNTQMSLGSETTDPVSVTLPEGKSVLQIAAAQAHLCVLLDGGQVQCWGQDWNGQLGGLGSDTSTGKTLEASSATGVAAGQFHTCVVYKDGTVKCAGAGGVHGAGQNSSTLALVPGVDSAVAITAGRYSSCALLADGTVRCWGDYGPGAPGTNETTTPVLITGEKVAACSR